MQVLKVIFAVQKTREKCVCIHILHMYMYVCICQDTHMYKNSVLTQVFHEAIEFYIDPK